MPYKRPARVLFVSTESSWAKTAFLYAKTHGAHWLEPRIGEPLSGNQTLTWADLVVTLDSAARANLPSMPPRVRQVHWAVEGEHDIKYHIRSMVGGMRMLSHTRPGEVPQ
ncbi:hypothetical protein [Acidihalobacter prosperus]